MCLTFYFDILVLFCIKRIAEYEGLHDVCFALKLNQSGL